jgi:deoxyribonuclease-4
VETTAGQGTGLGSKFTELACILDNSKFPDLLGVCVDTCHIFAAGYELRTTVGYRATIADLESAVGLDKVRFFHLNDSKKEQGSRIDRHEHIGKGKIGLDGFSNLLNDHRFARLPMTLETPKSDSLDEDRENLRILRSLLPKT